MSATIEDLGDELRVRRPDGISDEQWARIRKALVEQGWEPVGVAATGTCPARPTSRLNDQERIERAARYGSSVTRDPEGALYPWPPTAAPCPAWCDYDDVDSDGTVFHRSGEYALGGTVVTASVAAYDDKGRGVVEDLTLDLNGSCELTLQQARDVGNALLSFQHRVSAGSHPTHPEAESVRRG
jgi:hypothetical protein